MIDKALIEAYSLMRDGLNRFVNTREFKRIKRKFCWVTTKSRAVAFSGPK